MSLLFFCFFSLIFASNFSLRFTLVIFASKRNKAKWNSSLFFCFFHFFPFFIAFFTFFRFKFFASLRFSNFRFEAKRGGKLFRFNSIFFALFRFPISFRVKNKHFYQFFRLIFVSLRFFRLTFPYFTFVFASDFWCFASKWIMSNHAFFASKFRFRSESEGAP